MNKINIGKHSLYNKEWIKDFKEAKKNNSQDSFIDIFTWDIDSALLDFGAEWDTFIFNFKFKFNLHHIGLDFGFLCFYLVFDIWYNTVD